MRGRLFVVLIALVLLMSVILVPAPAHADDQDHIYDYPAGSISETEFAFIVDGNNGKVLALRCTNTSTEWYSYLTIRHIDGSTYNVYCDPMETEFIPLPEGMFRVVKLHKKEADGYKDEQGIEGLAGSTGGAQRFPFPQP